MIIFTLHKSWFESKKAKLRNNCKLDMYKQLSKVTPIIISMISETRNALFVIINYGLHVESKHEYNFLSINSLIIRK